MSIPDSPLFPIFPLLRGLADKSGQVDLQGQYLKYSYWERPGPPRPAHAAEGAANVPSLAKQFRRCGWNGYRTIGTRRAAFKGLEPELSRFNLGDGEVIEFQIVLVGQVVRVHAEMSGVVVQNLGRALGVGQIAGGLRRLISALSRVPLMQEL